MRTKQWSVGKVIKWILIVWFVLGCISMVASMAKEANTMSAMKELDPYGSNPNGGNRVIAYDEVNKKYTSRYIPSDHQANAPEEVGFILLYRVDKVDAWTTRGGRATADKVTLRLVDYRTGQEIASEVMTPGGGASSRTSHFEVSSQRVEQWLLSKLPDK